MVFMKKRKSTTRLPSLAVITALIPGIITLFFARSTVTVFEPPKFWLFQALVMGTLAAHVVDNLSKGNLRLVRWPLMLPVLVLNGVLIAALVGSLSPRWSFWGSYERAQGILAWLTLSLFAYLVYEFRIHKNFDEFLLLSLVGSSACVIVYGLLQSAGLDPWQWKVEEGSTPVFSTLGRSNYLAGYLMLIIPLTFGRLVKAHQQWQKAGLGLLLIGQLLVLVFSRSRGGWLSCGATVVIGLVAWGLLQHNPRWCAIGAIIAGLALATLLALNLLDMPEPIRQNPLLARLSTLHQTDAGSLAARLTIWKASLTLISQRPLLGHGPGTFTLAFAHVYPPELVYYQGREVMVDHAHNLWLQLGVEGGILGVIVLLILSLAIWRVGIRSLRGIQQPEAQFQQLSLLLALVANAFMDLLQPPTAATLIITWALYSLIVPAPTQKNSVVRLHSKTVPQRQLVAAVIAVAGMLLISALCLRPTLADYQMARGLQQGDFSAIEQAQQVLPWQDTYFHQGGRFMADSGTESGFSSAESQFLRAIKLCPAQPLYWADLGILYTVWAHHDPVYLEKAEIAYQKALAINNNQSMWLRGLGQVYVLRNEWERAEYTLQRAIALDATDAQAYMLLGDLYYVRERFSEAVLAYGHAHDLFPEMALPLAGLGRSYYRLGQCKDALTPLEQSHQIEATGPLTYQALAACYREFGQDDKADRIIDEGLQLYPQAESLLQMLP
ncbi:MAG: tetratricopeptide repeat protein [Chloroflexi bacterium ADurb.Bin360]|nr:MAG: tetratricopeptide repeat protein [Chloroflexi bacterium ADurb.Bin360]